MQRCEREMNVRRWDELCELMPPLSKAEYQALAHSIERNGVKYPILTLPDGRIIDGNHRWEISNGTAPYKTLDIPEEDGFVLGIAVECCTPTVEH